MRTRTLETGRSTRPYGAAKPAGSRPADRGFTLLELLIVVAVLGIVVTFVVLSVGSGHGRALDDAAARLLATASLVEQESILRRQPLGISFYRNAYRIHPVGTNASPSAADPLYGRHDLPRGIEVLGMPDPVFGNEVDDSDPVLVMFPDGEVMLNEIVLEQSGNGRRLHLVPRDGRLAIGGGGS